MTSILAERQGGLEDKGVEGTTNVGGESDRSGRVLSQITQGRYSVRSLRGGTQSDRSRGVLSQIAQGGFSVRSLRGAAKRSWTPDNALAAALPAGLQEDSVSIHHWR